jgi:hypothetical protein
MDGTGTLFIWFLISCVLGFIGGNVAKARGYSFPLGFILCFFLQLFGLLIVALLEPIRVPSRPIRRYRPRPRSTPSGRTRLVRR